jgi:hypothetical protein
MSAASGKSRTRRSMRVATLFTGVAAATVGMTQLANAQDTAHIAAKPSSKHIGGAIRPETAATTIESAVACGAGHSHPNWLHVSTTIYNEGGSYFYTSLCYGFKGTVYSPTGTGVRTECGGNNYGYLAGYVKGVPWALSFRPGTTYAGINKSHLSTVHISSWKGTDACGEAPDFGGGTAN